jgi:hypothetical protein
LPDVGKRGERGEGDTEIMVMLREEDMWGLEGDEVFGEFAKRVAPS